MYGEIKEENEDDEDEDREGVEAELDTTLHANVSYYKAIRLVTVSVCVMKKVHNEPQKASANRMCGATLPSFSPVTSCVFTPFLP